jgi:polyketide synthase
VSARRRCLLTGATGFIGSLLARRLLADGYEVRCVVRESSDTATLQALGVELIGGDLDSARSLSGVAEDCEHVVHCGALVSDWATVQEISRVNIDGTRALLAASLAAGVRRFLYISSTDVYGHPGGAAVEESHVARRFSNWYAQTKLDAEGEVRLAAASHRIETVILRPATVYGPGSTAVVGEIAQALRNRSMMLIDRGRALAGLCYVENLADLVLLALQSDAACGETFNATDELDVTWKRFTDDLAAGLGAPPARLSLPYPVANGIGYALEHGYRALRRATGLRTRPLLSRQAVQVMGRDQRFSARKARELLRWEPQVDYEQGLAATLAWLRAA